MQERRLSEGWLCERFVSNRRKQMTARAGSPFCAHLKQPGEKWWLHIFHRSVNLHLAQKTSTQTKRERWVKHTHVLETLLPSCCVSLCWFITIRRNVLQDPESYTRGPGLAKLLARWLLGFSCPGFSCLFFIWQIVYHKILQCDQDELLQELLPGSAISLHHCKRTCVVVGECCWQVMAHHIPRAQQTHQECHTELWVDWNFLCRHSLFFDIGLCNHLLLVWKGKKAICRFVILKHELSVHDDKTSFPLLCFEFMIVEPPRYTIITSESGSKCWPAFKSKTHPLWKVNLCQDPWISCQTYT